jgi:hypothetical protein
VLSALRVFEASALSRYPSRPAQRNRLILFETCTSAKHMRISPRFDDDRGYLLWSWSWPAPSALSKYQNATFTISLHFAVLYSNFWQKLRKRTMNCYYLCRAHLQPFSPRFLQLITILVKTKKAPLTGFIFGFKTNFRSNSVSKSVGFGGWKILRRLLKFGARICRRNL